MPSPPPPELVSALVGGPSILAGLDWHDEVTSTNLLAAEAAARGVPEVHAVLADVQTRGRGRRGRGWEAPPGTSLLMSLVLRPEVPPQRAGLLPLLAGVVLAQSVAPYLPDGSVGLKWPNDLLLRPRPSAPWRKAAGILVEAVEGAYVVGMGVNVDWRGVPRPSELREAATSLAEVVEEASGRAVGIDRWRVLTAIVGILGNRYRRWNADPEGFLDEYRARCATIGGRVRAQTGDDTIEGVAESVGADGALRVRTDDGGAVTLVAGDVTHLRSAD